MTKIISRPLVATGHKRPFLLISAVYFLLAITYGVVTPIFEAPDENLHYFTAQWIADNGRLPFVPQTAEEAERLDLQLSWTGQEAAQPPLYYLLASLVVAPFETDQARQLTRPNRFVQFGDASAMHNKNAFVHDPLYENWPWRGHVLAVHLLRLISTVIGWVTLFFIYQAARCFWPERPLRALWSMGAIACLPQFLALHAAVSNDVLAIVLVTAVLYFLMRSDIESARETGGPAWSVDLWLGLGVGLAALSKNQGVVLAVFVLGTVLIRGTGRLPARALFGRLVRISLMIVLVAGWLWWRNWWLYGDPTATNQFVAIAGGDRGYTVWQALSEWRGLWLSSIAVFGWFNILPPFWVHLIWTAGGGTAVCVALWLYFSRLVWPKTVAEMWRWLGSWPVLLFGWVLAVTAGLISFMMQTPAAQGRLLFPALLPIALLIGFGWDAFLEWMRANLLTIGGRQADFDGRPFRWALLIVLLSLHSYLLFGVISPTYARPLTLTSAEVPAHLQTPQVLSDQLTLLGVDIVTPEDGIVAGEMIELLLYWEKTAEIPTGERPQVVVDVLGREQTPLGKLQTLHGGGNYPADFWAKGEIILDRLFVPTFNELDADQLPVESQIWVKIAGQELSVPIGGVKLAPEQWPALASSPVAQLGDAIELVSVDISQTDVAPGETVTVDVVWQARDRVAQDWVTFVHLGRPNQPPLAQGDRPPLNGTYRTSLWRAGEQFVDPYQLVIPQEAEPGEYRLLLGMFNPADPTFARLPVRVEGEPQAENGLVIGMINISE